MLRKTYITHNLRSKHYRKQNKNYLLSSNSIEEVRLLDINLNQNFSKENTLDSERINTISENCTCEKDQPLFSRFSNRQ